MLLDKNCVNMNGLVTSAIYGILSDLFFLLLKLLFTFLLLLGKLVWVLNICKNVSILCGQPAPGASLPLFPKGWRESMQPNSSQNTDAVGTPLTTLMAALLAPSWGSAVNPVIYQKVTLNLYDLSYFWPLLLSFVSCAQPCAVPCGALCWQNWPEWCLWALWICDTWGHLMGEDGLTMGMFQIAWGKRRHSHCT